jgi:hypothetical protein
MIGNHPIRTEQVKVPVEASSVAPESFSGDLVGGLDVHSASPFPWPLLRVITIFSTHRLSELHLSCLLGHLELRNAYFSEAMLTAS